MVDSTSNEYVTLKKCDISELRAVVKRLREPDGCPWDKEQTHSTIRGNLIEEAYEVIDAIDRGDSRDLCEELGDILQNVVFHSQIAEENSEFSFDDVVGVVCEKLIRRHPHVFSNVIAETSDEVLRNWDAIKREEKSHASKTEALRSIPSVFPALLRADKLLSRSAKAGFAEKTTFEETLTAEELGDKLFDLVKLAKASHLDPELALSARLNQFIDTFEHWEKSQ